MKKHVRILGSMMMAVLTLLSANTSVRAQSQDVLNFFANELNLGGDDNDPPQDSPSASPGSSISDLFGDGGPQGQSSAPGASLGGEGVAQPAVPKYDPKQVEKEKH